jgi:hypothetical protein
MKKTTTWISALALVTATSALLGCGVGNAAGAAIEAKPLAPAVTERTAQLAQPPAAPAASCPTPDKAGEAPAKAASVKPRAEQRKDRVRTADASAKLRIKRLVLTEGVKGREPVEAKTSFSAADASRIYAFVEVENPAAEESEITVTFEPASGGAAHGNITLDVGASPRWRTWAFTRGARTAGAWTAIVRGPEGDVLAKAPFEVTL